MIKVDNIGVVNSDEILIGEQIFSMLQVLRTYNLPVTSQKKVSAVAICEVHYYEAILHLS